MNHQNISQIKPSAPVRIKAICQPYAARINGTAIGATTAPILAPELKIPVASARSRLGNHSATDLMAAGKFPDSPNPNPDRAIVKPKVFPVSACAMAKTLQMIMEMTYPNLEPTLSTIQPKASRPNA